MNKPNNNERCMSTASSTVSGIYSNLLPSPDPVCMFYFANTHPFGGIATPSSTSYSIDPYAGMAPTAEKTPHSKHQNQPKNRCTQQHLNDFTPWPRQTWQSKDLLSPLVQALQKQIGQNINDFEKVLRTIRELWYTPQNNNSVTDVQYLHNYYSFIQRQKQLNEQNFDYILNWQGQLNPAPHCVHFMESNAFAANEMMMTHSNRSRIDKPLGGMGFITSNNTNTNTTTTMFNKSKRPHTGLLRRRHSLPEIIMRKHQLASQKHVFSDMNATSAPSPPARERIPPSFESRERTRTSSSSSLGSSASTIVPNGFGSAGSTGSDSNLNRMFPTNGSMRQQLLRRLWHKEYRRLDRTGSLSPPLSRSLRTKRTLKLQETQPEVCLECQRLEVTHFNRSVPEIAMKHIKHTNSSISMTSSSASSLAFPRKSYSIETETLNDRSLMTISSVSSTRKSSPPVQKSNITNSAATKELDITSAANMLNQMNGNFETEDQMNGNDGSSQKNGDNSFFIEMEGDSINITTVARAESTAILDSTLCMSSNESSFRQHEQLTESTISQTSSQWFHESSGDGNNNNSDNDSIKSSKITEISHMKGPGGTYDAYHMSSGEIDIENESVVRLKTHEPLDQSTIDTIISQILVDSLNNIIVVQGKGNQSDSNGDSNNVELSISQTQIDNHTAMDEFASNPSSLPLPVTDQIYFPHYLSTETLSEYSTKLSDNSSATDLLPSNLVISVISGSTYPGDGGEMVVHRLTDMSRTESMEVQPSSAPSMHDDDDDENGNRIEDEANRPTKTATTVEEDDDDATSLVDSLDDPNAVANMSDLDAASNDVKMVEKSQAFFVPIEDSDTSCENVSIPADLNAAIADTMPDRLRERLQKRQMEIVERKEAEQKRRTEKIQKLISKHGTNRSSSGRKTNTSSFEVIPDESPKPLKKQIKVMTKKSKQLQSEIGSLESYTIDSQGNLKFVEAGKKSNGTKKVTTISGPAVKHIAIKKTITTSKPLVATKKPRESAASDKNPAEKRIKVTSNASSSRQRSKEIVSHRATRNVQKMTLGHHSPSDMITPDRDCGPRRMYQKTEIREGAKRIEILEIVECLNSSPDSLNASQSSSSSPPTDSTPSQSLIERFSAKHTSKIPVPVLAKNKSRRTLLNGNQQRTLKAQIRDSVSHYNGSSMNNSKVDQIIADLLIEALNHSTDIGIEFIKTPQNASPQSHIKLNPAKRMSLSSRRASGLAIAGSSGSGGSGKRSSHSSAKYQQVFDSIPEEKSGSLSYDSSPNDEQNSTSPPVDRASSNNSTGNPTSETESKTTTSTTTTAATKASSSPNKSNDTSRRATPPKFQSNGIQTKIASGKAAIESDQVKSETWFDCFGRAHVDSPVDGLLMEEGAPTTTAISSVATQDSALTSVPSEAPAREIQSVGSNSILPLIEETFETSATGNRGGDASKEKPFRKHARCSAQNHFDAPCSECESIENNLKEETSPIAKDKEISAAKLNGNELHLVAIKPSCHLPNGNENVWQMTHMDKYDTVGKFTLSPITVCSAQDTGTLTNNSSIKFGVDSSSFIVIHDENDNASHFLPNITSSEADQTPLRNGERPSKSQNQFERPCEDCCFCNPTLHHKRRTENSPKKCNFCSSRQQSTQTTPATSTRYQDKGQSVNDNNNAASAKSSSIPVERIYESNYRSNHTHIRTHSKESDTINTQCTKKTNKKVRKTLLNGSDDRLNANAEPNNRNETEERNGNEVNGNKATKHKSSIPKLPPATNEWTNNSMDSATSPTSSHSTGSSTKSNRRQDSKSVPNLPRADRSLQNIESSPNSKSQKTRTNSRYQNFYGNDTASATDERTAVTPNDPKSKPTDLMHQQQQHSHLVLAPHRKFSFDSNGNANVYQRSTKDYCNLPHISDHRLNHDHSNRIVAKQTAKKTIKRSEYSVSVASATTTTRTISNFANGKRAMSIQALNANSFQRFHNGNRRGGPYGRRDHSADAGQLTYRLSATPSPLPSSSFYSPTTAGGYDDDTDRNGNHRNNLSVCGNAIAPERKPPVPTMSERDVTRRHDACFTRTRSIFL
ncbi:uncharacterized protein LOC129575254 isoform X2 [Sitodiplosis mosellana]|uniref:uncharacterized protein LOC129575254 isoform X2 n=1 Tax=Sitodiplosis mosellana TaxID=263140 RepID=UPI002443BA17|nr:uncharacterized protein LOC129575254 isoform X2 [Sitodiplosis mosellana]